MTKKPMSPKRGKKLPNANTRRLADDDYKAPAMDDSFSDSDLAADRGVTPRTANHETREEGALQTMAQAERQARKSRQADQPEREARP